jgi:hypothetical protein
MPSRSSDSQHTSYMRVMQSDLVQNTARRVLIMSLRPRMLDIRLYESDAKRASLGFTANNNKIQAHQEAARQIAQVMIEI